MKPSVKKFKVCQPMKTKKNTMNKSKPVTRERNGNLNTKFNNFRSRPLGRSTKEMIEFDAVRRKMDIWRYGHDFLKDNIKEVVGTQYFIPIEKFRRLNY